MSRKTGAWLGQAVGVERAVVLQKNHQIRCFDRVCSQSGILDRMLIYLPLLAVSTVPAPFLMAGCCRMS